DEDGKPRERGVAAELDPRSGAVLDRREGTDEEIDAGDVSNALADFIVELHVNLHVPDPWGLLLTGVLGLAMLVAAVTGFVVHRHLIRELFTLRRYPPRRPKAAPSSLDRAAGEGGTVRGADGGVRAASLLKARDTHVIAGTWNLPFAFILAFTGSYFSFGSALGIPAVAMVAFGGDQEKMIEAVVGNPPAVDETPATMADLDAMIADVRARSGAEPSFVSIQHWGRADALVTMFMHYRDGALTGPTYVYGGASGEFRYAKPNLGLVPSAGGTLFALMAPLHFGNFAGVFSKAVWFALGFAGAYVSITGLLLWSQRRQEHRTWRVLARVTAWVGYGLPLALVAAGCAYFPARMRELTMEPAMFAAFFAAALASAVLAWKLPELQAIRRALLGATAIGLVALPPLRWACGGVGWIDAFDAGLPTVIALDLIFVIGGMFCLWMLRMRRAPAAAAAPALAETQST
ncbi:MAG: PepSY-associated TM helix domain-containing protein, partial [Gammaproteobacteria bacterium]